MTAIPRIGIDAMGGDFGPSVIVEGTLRAFREMPGGFEVTLVGDEPELRATIRRAQAERFPIQIVHATERIDMAEKAVAAARKNQSSLGVLTQLHKEGRLD